MFKKLILLLCLVAPLTLVAQEKIAFVNTQEIFAKMPELKDAESKLATKGEALNKTIQALQTEYQSKLEAYSKKLEAVQKGDTTITEGDLQDAGQELSQLQERIQTRQENAQAEFSKEQQTLIAPLQEKMMKAIKEVGDENGFQYVFDSAALLYTGSSAIDASKQVKTKLGIVD